MITKFETINTERLRNYLVERELFTEGDSKDYEVLFRKVVKYRGNMIDLQNIAVIIINHSSKEALIRYTETDDVEEWVAVIMSGIQTTSIVISYIARAIEEVG